MGLTSVVLKSIATAALAKGAELALKHSPALLEKGAKLADQAVNTATAYGDAAEAKLKEAQAKAGPVVDKVTGKAVELVGNVTDAVQNTFNIKAQATAAPEAAAPAATNQSAESTNYDNFILILDEIYDRENSAAASPEAVAPQKAAPAAKAKKKPAAKKTTAKQVKAKAKAHKR